MIIAKLKILFIFVSILSDQWLGSKMAPENRGFFNPIQYGGGLVFVPETGDPDQGSDSGNGHRFYLVAVKNKVHASYLTLDMMLHKTEQLTQERRVA